MVWLLAGICLFLGGCTGGPEERASAAGGYEATDSRGNTLLFQQPPSRIVSYSISTDEILAEMIPAERIAAVTYLADDPGISNITNAVKKIPGRIQRNTSAEGVLALQPDLVVVPDFIAPEVIKSMQDIGLPVYVYRTPHTMEEIKAVIRDLALVTGDVKQAEPLIRHMDKQLEKARRHTETFRVKEKRRAVFLRENGVYFSSNSSFRELCRYAGIEDITADMGNRKAGWLSVEEVVHRKPDIFVVADWNYDGHHDTGEHIQAILTNPAYQDTPAWKNKNIIVIRGALLLSVSQYMADAALELAEKVYPDRSAEHEDSVGSFGT